jgi:hypothetical protein
LSKEGRPWCSLFWLLATVTLLALIWIVATDLGMQEAPLNWKYPQAGMPAAISDLRGRKHDYAAYMEVAEAFIDSAPGEQPEQTEARLQKALSVDIRSPESVWLVSGDDKGLIDLVYLAFRFFGPTVPSIFKMTAVVFALSVALYVCEFYNRGPRMALLLSLLASLYAVSFTFGITDQSVSLIAPRFLGFLGGPALLHLLLLIVDGRSLSKPSMAVAAGQALILVFVLHLRSSEMWQYLCLAGAFLIVMIIRWRRITPSLFVIPGLVLCTLLGLSLYRKAVYNPYYFSEDVATRVLWHNAVMGLAVNPALRERYGLNALDDHAVINAVGRHLESSGQTEARDILFANQNWANTNYLGFKWSIYEPAARELYYRIWTESPGEVMKTYFVLMPKSFIANVYYMATGRQVFQDLLFPVGTFEKLSMRIAKDLYLSPFRLAPIVILLMAAAVLAVGRSPIIDGSCILASAAAALASTIPPFLATPVMHYDQLTVMMMLTFAYLIALLALSLGLRWMYNLILVRRRN